MSYSDDPARDYERHCIDHPGEPEDCEDCDGDGCSVCSDTGFAHEASKIHEREMEAKALANWAEGLSAFTEETNPPAWHPYPSTLAKGYRLALTVGQFYDVRTEHSEYRAEYLPDLTGYETEFIFVHGDGSVVRGDKIEVFCGVEREESK